MIYPSGRNAHLNLNAISWPFELDLIWIVNRVRQCIFNFNGCGVLVGAKFAECGVSANNHCHQLGLHHYFGNCFRSALQLGLLCSVEWVQRGERKVPIVLCLYPAFELKWLILSPQFHIMTRRGRACLWQLLTTMKLFAISLPCKPGYLII